MARRVGESACSVLCANAFSVLCSVYMYVSLLMSCLLLYCVMSYFCSRSFWICVFVLLQSVVFVHCLQCLLCAHCLSKCLNAPLANGRVGMFGCSLVS